MSREEDILQAIIDGGDPALLEPPQSRGEVLLQAVLQKNNLLKETIDAIGSEKRLRRIKRIALTTDADSVIVDKDENEAPLSLQEIVLLLHAASGIGDETSGTAWVTVNVNDIVGNETYLRDSTLGSAGFVFSAGNIRTFVRVQATCFNNAIMGSYSQICAYGAQWPGTPYSGADGMLTVPNQGFDKIRKLTITGGGGATESNIHAGATIELWGIDA